VSIAVLTASEKNATQRSRVKSTPKEEGGGDKSGKPELSDNRAINHYQSCPILAKRSRPLYAMRLSRNSSRGKIIDNYHAVMIFSLNLLHNMKHYYLLTRNTAEDKAGTQD